MHKNSFLFFATVRDRIIQSYPEQLFKMVKQQRRGVMKKILLFALCLAFGSAYAQTVVTSMVEDFNSPVDLDVWNPNKLTHPDQTPVFTVTQEDNALKVVMKQLSFP